MGKNSRINGLTWFFGSAIMEIHVDIATQLININPHAIISGTMITHGAIIATIYSHHPTGELSHCLG